MSSDAYDWSDKLDFGTDWEATISERLPQILTALSVENISFDENPELQLSGIDSILAKKEPTIDVKTQRYEHTDSDNLPIEVMSVLHKHKPGWFFTSDADMVVWVYENRAGTNLYHTGYFMPLTGELRDWFDDHATEFPFRTVTTKRGGERWETGIRLVPIDDFPDHSLVEFDPRLPTDKETPQSDLARWVQGDTDAE